MAEQSFSYESVFRFLRTNLAGFTYEEIDELENYVIGLGIKGYKHWQEKWTRKPEYALIAEALLCHVEHTSYIFYKRVQQNTSLMRCV